MDVLEYSDLNSVGPCSCCDIYGETKHVFVSNFWPDKNEFCDHFSVAHGSHYEIESQTFRLFPLVTV